MVVSPVQATTCLAARAFLVLSHELARAAMAEVELEASRSDERRMDARKGCLRVVLPNLSAQKQLPD